MIERFVRIIGLVALFWTSWPLALFGFLMISITNESYHHGFALIKNDTAWLIVGIITLFLALLGIWFFPLVAPITAQIIAVCAGILALIEIMWRITHSGGVF